MRVTVWGAFSTHFFTPLYSGWGGGGVAPAKKAPTDQGKDAKDGGEMETKAA